MSEEVKNQIEVLGIDDQEDGGAIIHFEMSDDMVQLFMRQGMRVALEELSEKYVVVKASEWEDWIESGMNVPNCNTIELTDQEAQGYYQIGVLKAITDGIDAAKKEIGEPKEEQLEFNFEDSNDGC
jgi:hypothetical protein